MESTWRLPNTSKKISCPDCRKKTFKPYVYTDDNRPVDETRFGRCDRQNECGYHLKPGESDLDKDHKRTKVVYTNTPVFPDEVKVMSGQYQKYPDNYTLSRTPSNLHKFLATKGIPETFLYDEGVLTTKSGLTAFLIRDIAGRLCNVKYFKYKEDGHRDKSFESFSLKAPEQKNPYIREYYPMPIYGEHKFDLEKKRIACIVESEKTRVIAKFFYPDFDWGGCGSANGLSDGTSDTTDKITPLKDRTVYWVNDNDKAARGEFKVDDAGKEVFVPCSSIRNLRKHKIKHEIVDLFADKVEGYDLGDALLDGLKPEIKPAWLKQREDIRFKSYVPPSDYRIQKELASQVGEGSGISDEFDKTFSWMRTHVNGEYGWSNDGKGTMLDFKCLVKSKVSGWKHCLFKQEDMGSYFSNGKSKINGDRIYAKLAWTLVGKVPPPFEVYAKKNSLGVMTDDEYAHAMEWVRKHFFIVNPQDRKYRNIFDEFLFFYEVFGVDHFGIDPWNTVLLDEMERGDERLIQAFIAEKELALKTNTVITNVSHAGSRHEVKEKSGAFKVVNQFMQLGGSAWDIKMDGSFSTHRPFRHKDPNDPRVHYYNLKQRDSEIVGAERGVYKNIQFDRHKRQYYFDGVNPIDGTKITPIVETTTATQSAIPYTPSWRQNKKKKSYEEHLQQDWGQSQATDEPPF